MRVLLTTAAAFAALSLAACGTPATPAPVPPSGTASTTSSAPSMLGTADEKAMIAVEGTYRATLILVNAAVDAGALKGEAAAKARDGLRVANTGVNAAWAAYKTGDAAQMYAQHANIAGAIASVRRLLGK